MIDCALWTGLQCVYIGPKGTDIFFFFFESCVSKLLDECGPLTLTHNTYLRLKFKLGRSVTSFVEMELTRSTSEHSSVI